MSDDEMPELIHVEFDICSPCAVGVRGECHAPGCVFWMCDAPPLSFLDTLGDRVELRHPASGGVDR